MFHGSLVAIVTPMHADGEVDYDSFGKLIDWHLDSQTDGLVILGTTGESVTIEADEREKIINHAVAQVSERIPIIVGTGTNSTRKSIENTQKAMELGADAALLVTPYYNKPTQEGLYQHYKAIAKAVPIPQILYNVPSRTSCDLLPETVGRLGQMKNIIAIKEATGSMERLEALKQLDCEVDLLTGDDKSAMEFMLQGGQGVISVAANVAPTLMHNLCQAALGGDRAKAEQINAMLTPLFDELFAESNPIPAKWALKLMGMIQEGIRLPLTPLAEQFHKGLRAAMQTAQIEF